MAYALDKPGHAPPSPKGRCPVGAVTAGRAQIDPKEVDMASFAEAHAAWQRAEQEAQAVPSATTREAAQQAHFALTHHPAAHKARGEIQQMANRQRSSR